MVNGLLKGFVFFYIENGVGGNYVGIIVVYVN